jgi:hypothetical protein
MSGFTPNTNAKRGSSKRRKIVDDADEYLLDEAPEVTTHVPGDALQPSHQSEHHADTAIIQQHEQQETTATSARDQSNAKPAAAVKETPATSARDQSNATPAAAVIRSISQPSERSFENRSLLFIRTDL